MQRKTLDLLACPACHGALEFQTNDAGSIQTGMLTCTPCRKEYPIQDGIPHFIKIREMDGLNRRFASMYDHFSWAYRAFSKVAFAFIGMSEEEGRREILDRLEPGGGRVLEVSIGPGVNLPYLVERADVGEVHGLDISFGQLRNCQRYARGKGWEVDLYLGNGEQLPFHDKTFDGVFHVGGINFFSNKKAAIDEMSRVAKPGARILIADETEKGARGYERVIPGFKRSFGGERSEIKPPVELVPSGMLDTRVYDVWKGWLYCIEFRKPTQPA